MQLELATVISCDPNGCWVVSTAGGLPFEAHYSTLVVNRVKIRPRQLVALDMEPPLPEIVWRWYPARVIDAGERVVIVQERDRQLPAARVPGLETPVKQGDEIWVTGMEGVWELHDRVVDGKPSDLSRMREKVFPRIVTLWSNSEQA